MPPDPNSMQSSPDSLLASLQPANQEYIKQSSLQSAGSEGEGSEGEISSSLFTLWVREAVLILCVWEGKKG